MPKARIKTDYIKGKKKKNKRRYLQGKSKEERQKYILENRFKDYSKIKAPSNFSLIENTEESLKFIAKIEKCLKNRSKVFVNLTDVETIGSWGYCRPLINND